MGAKVMICIIQSCETCDKCDKNREPTDQVKGVCKITKAPIFDLSVVDPNCTLVDFVQVTN
jgi:hypothetical protein